MTPLFANADLISLIKNNDYKFIGFLLFDENLNLEFKKELEKDLKNLHISTGKDLMICTFLPPTKTWIEKNYSWYENTIKNNSKVDIDLHRLVNEYSTNRTIENYLSLRDVLNDEFQQQKEIMQTNLMHAFNLNQYDLPALILYDKYNSSIGIHKNQNVENLALLATEITFGQISQKIQINLSAEEILKFENAISSCTKFYSEHFHNFADFIIRKKIKDKNESSSIEDIKNQFPEFQKLKKPSHFYWHKSLLECLNKHRDLIRHYIDGINHIEENTNLPGLDNKRIKDFWRFRINRKYRALYFKEGDKIIHFYLGDHDYGLN
jgi:hypothetical protein